MILCDITPMPVGITVVDFSDEIGISRTTIYKYRDLCDYILDFERDYPSGEDGYPIKSCGLTEYQAWAITALIAYRRNQNLSMSALEAFIKQSGNQAWVTKQSYEQYQEKFKNGHEAIRNK
ncbi:hypothetical protein H6G64_03985 [Calothrix sp. FACHB-156]|nr:hypothetical protein [Calothrix sp. FACHB-156]